MYINRTVESAIIAAGKSFPCVVVYGPRQVGKSTTIDYLFGDEYNKVTLDDGDDRALAVSNPKLFLENYAWPVVIDEIQKAPKLLDEIKKIIDEQRLKWVKNGEERRLMYILTGSNRFELQEDIADSLAGRCAVIDMASFTAAEKYGYDAPLFNPEISELRKRERSGRKYRSKKEIFEDIFTGGIPDICTGVAERDIYFKSYVNTYIERDVMKLIEASSELQFRNFISIVALRTAQELHYDEIAATGHFQLARAVHGCPPADHATHRALLAHNSGQGIGADAVLHAYHQGVLSEQRQHGLGAFRHIVCLGGNQAQVKVIRQFLHGGHAVYGNSMFPAVATYTQPTPVGQVCNFHMFAHQPYVVALFRHERGGNPTDSACADNRNPTLLHIRFLSSCMPMGRWHTGSGRRKPLPENAYLIMLCVVCQPWSTHF